MHEHVTGSPKPNSPQRLANAKKSTEGKPRVRENAITYGRPSQEVGNPNFRPFQPGHNTLADKVLGREPDRFLLRNLIPALFLHALTAPQVRRVVGPDGTERETLLEGAMMNDILLAYDRIAQRSTKTKAQKLLRKRDEFVAMINAARARGAPPAMHEIIAAVKEEMPWDIHEIIAAVKEEMPSDIHEIIAAVEEEMASDIHEIIALIKNEVSSGAPFGLPGQGGE